MPFSFTALAGLVMAIIALRRTGKKGDLARRVAELERQLREIQSAPSPLVPSTKANGEEGIAPSVEPLPPVTPPATETPAEDQAPLETPADPSAKPPLEPELHSPLLAETVPVPPWRAIDWERWVGVRGAAALGGVALASAGMLFFRYSIEHGLISPTLRVILATLVGLGSIAAPQLRWRKDYPDVANAMCGAGLVVLYASFWAARSLYGLIGIGTAFTLMALVTSAGCLLALREESLLIAVLGLVGGFATPFMVASHADSPIGLFGYLLILDLALVGMARRRGWPRLAALSLVGTLIYQFFWIGFRMGPDQVIVGLAVLGLFALVFALAAPRAAARDAEWRMTQAGGVLVPFAFAVYIASRGDLGPHLYPIGILLLLLSASASWIDRGRDETMLGPGAAAAGAGVVAVWILTKQLTNALAWETVAVSVALAVVFHGFAEARRAVPGLAGAALAALVSAGGLGLATTVAAVRAVYVPIWPWVAGALSLTLLAARQGTGPGRQLLQPAAWGALGLALSLLHVVHGGEPTFSSFAVFFVVLLSVVAASHAAALAQGPSPARFDAERGAALLSVVLLLFLPATVTTLRPPADRFLGGSIALGFLGALAATRAGSGEWYAAAVGATALAHFAWSASQPPGAASLGALALQMTAVVLFTGWPVWAGHALRGQRFAWYASALAGPAWFWPLRRLFELRFGDAFIGVLPLSLGAISIAALAEARRQWPEADPLRRTAVVWFSAIALGFVSAAIPLQLEKEWITIGWALEALALAVLWQRLDHPGLKYWAAALTVAVTLRLVVNDEVLGYHARPAWRILNWLAYTYLVPTAALVGAAVTLGRSELARARPWEQPIYRFGFAAVASLTGVAAIAIAFVWINLAIADWFSTGTMVSITFRRGPAQDLTMSLAWGLYGLGLLAIGVAWAISGLRWVSLFVLILTIGKVFLYDLGQLQDLFRVVSLLGLAVSLIVVSLAYQRFVFRKTATEDE